MPHVILKMSTNQELVPALIKISILHKVIKVISVEHKQLIGREVHVLMATI